MPERPRADTGHWISTPQQGTPNESSTPVSWSFLVLLLAVEAVVVEVVGVMVERVGEGRLGDAVVTGTKGSSGPGAASHVLVFARHTATLTPSPNTVKIKTANK
jgi:hypothetical protein